MRVPVQKKKKQQKDELGSLSNDRKSRGERESKVKGWAKKGGVGSYLRKRKEKIAETKSPPNGNDVSSLQQQTNAAPVTGVWEGSPEETFPKDNS